MKSAVIKNTTFKIKNKRNMKNINNKSTPKQAFFILLVMCYLMMAFTTENPFIIIKGEKYYKCKTQYETDTIQSGYGDVTIVKKQIIFYDHFDCGKNK